MERGENDCLVVLPSRLSAIRIGKPLLSWAVFFFILYGSNLRVPRESIKFIFMTTFAPTRSSSCSHFFVFLFPLLIYGAWSACREHTLLPKEYRKKMHAAAESWCYRRFAFRLFSRQAKGNGRRSVIPCRKHDSRYLFLVSHFIFMLFFQCFPNIYKI